MKPFPAFFGFILIMTLFAYRAFSQTLKTELSGKVIDRNQKPVEYAIVKVVGQKDSSSFLTNGEGEFFFRKLAEGTYRVKISFVGYKSYSGSVVITKQKPSVNMGTITLEEGLNLKEVNVNAEVTPVIVKQDTIEFNASAFKTQPNASVEDLLKKLPGLEVDKDGNIKTEGENITKVTVDGKEFFGSDPKIATKNLPADAIKKVQLIDEKSEEAKATGLDDGKRSKVLNLTLKDDRKKGTFGNASVSGGTEGRYLGSLSLNHYNKEKQMNILLLGNNVNQTGFSMEDIGNFSGGSNGYYSAQGRVNGVNVAGGSAGLNNTLSGGFNYSDNLGKKKKTRFSGSYFAFGNSLEQQTESNSQSFRPNGTFLGSNYYSSNNNSESHRINIRFTANPDSLTNIMLSPRLEFSYRNGDGTGGSLQTTGNAEKITETTSTTSNRSFSPNLNGSYSISRRFRNRTGRLSLFIYNYTNKSDATYWQESNNQYYQIGRVQTFNREDQREYTFGGLNVSGTVSRTVSKDKRSSVFLSPQYNSRTNNSSTDAYEYNPSSGFYEIRVDSLVNNSRSTTREISPSLGFNRSTKKWNLYLSAGLQRMFLDGNITSRGTEQQVKKRYNNVIPYFSFNYYPKKGTTFTTSMNFNVNAPSISDLQVEKNNPNPLNINYGNPDLQASKYLSFNSSYRTSDAGNGSYKNLSLNYRRTFDAIIQSSTIDTVTGIRYLQPVNVNGNYSLVLNGNFTIPTGIKSLRISPGVNFSNYRNKGFIDGLPNNSDRISGGPVLTFSYSYKEMLDITLNNRSSYTWVHNSVSSPASRDRRYYNFDNGGSLSVMPIKKWRITTDFTHRSYAQQQFVLLNAGVQRTMMKKDRLILELKGFDLLNRNSDLNRYVTDTYISDTRSNNLNRYFFIKMTYKVTKVGGPKAGIMPPPPILID